MKKPWPPRGACKACCAKNWPRTPKRYGDARRSPLVARQPAQAMAETVLVSSEPVTVVLSQKGWVRAAKGHEIDPTTLSYKAGDGFMAAVQGKSTQLAVFLDTSGPHLCPASPHPALGARPGRTADRAAQPAGRRVVCSGDAGRCRRSLCPGDGCGLWLCGVARRSACPAAGRQGRVNAT